MVKVAKNVLCLAFVDGGFGAMKFHCNFDCHWWVSDGGQSFGEQAVNFLGSACSSNNGRTKKNNNFSDTGVARHKKKGDVSTPTQTKEDRR
ncbi:hypothetical protein JHK85_020310 [Glycine max]|nr:hypothetical protein JHK85_020310 [Glycine max]